MPRENALKQTAVARIRRAGGKVLKLHPVNGAGEPDLLFCVAGRAGAIELKQPGKNPRPIQTRMLAEWCKAGAVTAVCRTPTDIDHVLDIMRRHPAPSPARW